MKFWRCLTILVVLSSCPVAYANWRDDNPNQPNGYAASMYRYHHGTPDDDGPHDGYRASSFRNRHGLDVYAPPSEDESDGWGSRWGNSSEGGSGLGRHFRQGQAESQAYWSQRLSGQMQQRANGPQAVGLNHYRPQAPGYNTGQGNGFSPYTSQSTGFSRPPQPGGYAIPAQSAGYNSYGYANAPSVPPQPNFNLNYQHFENNKTGNYQYAPNAASYNGYANPTALRSAVSQPPLGTLLRNSRGGFNRIYSQ